MIVAQAIHQKITLLLLYLEKLADCVDGGCFLRDCRFRELADRGVVAFLQILGAVGELSACFQVW